MAVLKYLDPVSGTYQTLASVTIGGGSIIITGSGAPDDVLTGADGDFYLDSTNHILYGPKDSLGTPVWPVALDGSGGGGSGVRTYEQSFATPSTDWVVVHNFGTYDVEVNCFDITGTNEYLVEVDYDSPNQVTVHWYYPTSGIARIIG